MTHSKKLRIAYAQLNFTVGDIDGNITKCIEAAIKARDTLKADLVIFPELSVTGYPPEDLLLRPSFLEAAAQGLLRFQNAVDGIHCIIGHPKQTEHGLQNTCSVMHHREILTQYAKQKLPNYGIFDECRYFTPGHSSCVFSIRKIKIGLLICEDSWHPETLRALIKDQPDLIVIPNASPFEIQKHEKRLAMLKSNAALSDCPIVYVNTVGGQDEWIFDGGSLIVDANGNLLHQAHFFQEEVNVYEMTFNDASPMSSGIQTPSREARMYHALTLGVHDYIHKNHFNGVLVGLSGGIDSAVTLAIAVDALGKERVRAILMPSRYTSERSLQDAMALINALDVDYQTLSIEPAFTSFLNTLSLDATSTFSSLTAQNIQARCRAVLLMALSNESGYLVLSTSNRSEIAVGYTTIYGDMSGGFAVLKDVYKTDVYRLAKWRNQQGDRPLIPHSIIERVPTAELAPNQKDEDSLPPYPLLDALLEKYLNASYSQDELIADGFSADIVKKVIGLIHNSEYKRRQAPIGPRLDEYAFGRDWRYPITSGYKK